MTIRRAILGLAAVSFLLSAAAPQTRADDDLRDFKIPDDLRRIPGKKAERPDSDKGPGTGKVDCDEGDAGPGTGKKGPGTGKKAQGVLLLGQGPNGEQRALALEPGVRRVSASVIEAIESGETEVAPGVHNISSSKKIFINCCCTPGNHESSGCTNTNGTQWGCKAGSEVSMVVCTESANGPEACARACGACNGSHAHSVLSHKGTNLGGKCN